MGVLVCPISRKHFLRVVSEWISIWLWNNFLGISDLVSELPFKVKSHSHIVTIVLMASLIQVLKRRYCHYLSFDSFCLFLVPAQHISIKTWACWRKVACYTISIPHFLSTDICTPSVPAPWEFLVILWKNGGGGFFFFYSIKRYQSFIVQNMTCYLTSLLLSYQVRSPNENLIE